jgi:hypothetical protein
MRLKDNAVDDPNKPVASAQYNSQLPPNAPTGTIKRVASGIIVQLPYSGLPGLVLGAKSNVAVILVIAPHVPFVIFENRIPVAPAPAQKMATLIVPG